MTYTPPPVFQAHSGAAPSADTNHNADHTDAPLRATNPARALARYFRRYAGFSGRSSRSEYWWIALFNVVVFVGLSILALVVQTATTGAPLRDEMTFGSGLLILVLVLWLFGTFIPNLALGVRRLHDVNMSGWFILLNLVPVGGIVVLVFMLLPGNPAGARFDRRL